MENLTHIKYSKHLSLPSAKPAHRYYSHCFGDEDMDKVMCPYNSKVGKTRTRHRSSSASFCTQDVNSGFIFCPLCTLRNFRSNYRKQLKISQTAVTFCFFLDWPSKVWSVFLQATISCRRHSHKRRSLHFRAFCLCLLLQSSNTCPVSLSHQ